VADEGAGQILAELSQVDEQLHDCLLIGARIEATLHNLETHVSAYQREDRAPRTRGGKERGQYVSSLRNAIQSSLFDLAQAVAVAEKTCSWKDDGPEVTPVESAVQDLLDLGPNPPPSLVYERLVPGPTVGSITSGFYVRQEDAVRRRR
jgi:hypothetical protein